MREGIYFMRRRNMHFFLGGGGGGGGEKSAVGSFPVLDQGSRYFFLL